MLSKKIEQIVRAGKESAFHNESHFKAKFDDRLERTERDTNWSDISEKEIVRCGNSQKVVHASEVKELELVHKGISHKLTCGDGEKLYQSIKARIVFPNPEKKEPVILGRIIGKIKNGEVVEEYFLNEQKGGVEKVI